MLPLHNSFGSIGELEESLSAGLREVVSLPRGARPVAAAGGAFPDLDSLEVDLSDAQLGTERPGLSPGAEREEESSLRARRFELRAHPARVGGAEVDLDLTGDGVVLRCTKDQRGHRWLELESAEAGRVDVRITREHLELLVLTVARAEAKRHGITVQDVELDVRGSGRSLDIGARITAGKLIMKATIEVSGHAEIDDALNATLSGLSCDGKGALAGMACGVLRPQLKRYEGCAIPLAAFSLGSMKLRDLTVTTGDGVRIQAEIGAA